MSVLETALSLIENGISILPIRPDGSKKPAIEKWEHLANSIPDEFEVRGWYRGKDANRGVAVIGGPVSGGLEIIDIENPDTAKKWASRVAENGGAELLQKLVVIKSPRGFHLYFRCDQPGRNADLARRAATPEELAERPTQKYKKLIETRGERGYALTAGSPAHCHELNIAYELTPDSPPITEIPHITMQERELLIETARSLNEYFTGHEYAEPSTPIVDGDRPGDLFNQRATWAEVLEPHGWRSQRQDRWIRPGGKRDSAQVVVNGRYLWVFTSSAGLPTEKALSKFAVYTLLTHGEDFQAAGKALAKQGYYVPKEKSQTDFEPPAEEESEEEIEDIAVWPTLPLEALHGIAGKIAKIATENCEADPAAVLATFLVRAGATFGANGFFNVGETKHYPRLFSLIVGRSARARKGTSLDPVDRFFDLAESRAHVEKLNVSPGPLSSGEGLINAVRDAAEVKEDAEEEGKKKREKPDQGIADKRLLVIEAEFAGALRAMQRQGNNISAIMRTAWDKGNIAPLTRHSPIKTTGAHISIVGHITEPELLSLLEKVEVLNGFANRFLWVCARRSKLVALPEPMDEHAVSEIATDLAKIIQHAQQKRVINFHPASVQIWRQVYPKLTQEIDGIIGSVTSRAEAQVIRLALVYALLDCDDMIRAEHMTAALAMWDYCEKSVRYIFSSVNMQTEPDDDISDKILEALKDGEKSQSDLVNLFKRNVSSKQLTAALRSLQAVGRLNQRIGDNYGKGRRPVLWSLAFGGK